MMQKSRLRKLCAVLLGITLMLSCGIGVSAAETGNGERAVLAVDSTLTDGYQQARKYYLTHSTLSNYWAVWGAYAVCGDTVGQNHVYVATDENPDQIGATTLARIMMGEDPYHFNGKDLVTGLEKNGTVGSFSVPVFNFLALRAAGGEISAADEEKYIDYCCARLTDLSTGPDIGGWAAVALMPYKDDPRYQEKISAATQSFTTETSKNMAGASMGSASLSQGCVVTGLTALTYAGINGCDVTADEPWKGYAPLTNMYNAMVKGETGVDASIYNHQYYMEFADLYNVLVNDGKPCWLNVGISAADLQVLKGKADTVLADEDAYIETGVENLKTALNAANGLSAEELNMDTPDWGRTYYNLSYALEKCPKKGDVSSFKDLAAGAWYVPAVTNIVQEQIMNGISTDTFDPEGKLTRGMMVRILWNVAGCPSYTIDNPFEDIAEGVWYTPAILWAKENGVAAGISDSTFAPNDLVTREQAAAFICRFAGKMGISLNSGNGKTFTDDAQISSFAKDNVYTLANEKIISGYSDGSFGPKQTATRAQAAQMISLLLAKK